jgi:tRNA1Val (adenine37-N6)-methyltransferase
MIFQFKEFSVKHSDSLLKVNTDAVLLGALVPEHLRLRSALDIGTGCGVIALMLAQKFENVQIDAIEPDAASCKEAAYNFSRSKFSERMEVFQSSLQDFNSSMKYDLIVSNPPYFEVPDFSKGNNPQDIGEKRKKLATQYSLTFDALVKHVSGVLEAQGTFGVIIPFASKEDFTSICTVNKLWLNREINIRSKPGTPFIRTVLFFGFDKPAMMETTELTIYNTDGSRHSEYRRVTADYYL